MRNRILAFAALFAAATFALASDPFAEENKRGTATKEGPPHLLPDPPKADAKLPPANDRALKKTLEYLDLKASVSATKVRRGQVVALRLDGTTKPYAYTYSAVTKGEGTFTRVSLADAKFGRLLAPITESPTKTKGPDKIHHGTFFVQQDLYVAPDAPTGRQTLALVVALGVCTKEDAAAGTGNTCFPPVRIPLEVAIEVEDSPALPPPADLEKRTQAMAAAAADPKTPSVGAGNNAVNFNDLGALLTAAVVGAVLMLLTPCVFPMIPITVNFFIKQSEKEHHRPFLMASVYAGSIVVLLTAVILGLGSAIIDLANHPWFNLAMGAVLMLFALGLFGLFEVDLTKFFGAVAYLLIAFGLATLGNRLFAANRVLGNELAVAVVALVLAAPTMLVLGRALTIAEGHLGLEGGGLVGLLAQQEARGGMLGAAFMAMTFTITSFSCTGPFLGILLAPLANAKPPLTNLILAALTYAATFAAPFFVLALFPTWLKKLPKSGGWMTTIKVAMGFLEVGAALKFLSVTDYAWFPGNPRIFTYDTVLCAWIALSVASALYLFGTFKLDHDDPEPQIGVVRMLFGTIFLGMAVYLTPLLFGITPKGLVMEAAVAFLPVQLDDTRGKSSGGGGHDAIPWIKDDYEAAWKLAVKEKKLIFIDFTGVNCPNCRDNERNVLDKREAIDLLKQFVCVAMYTDTVPNPKLSSIESMALALKQREYQVGLVDDLAQPTYVIIDPDAQTPFDGIHIKAKVLGKRTGLLNLSDFVGFLKAPLAVQAATPPPEPGPRLAKFDPKRGC